MRFSWYRCWRNTYIFPETKRNKTERTFTHFIFDSRLLSWQSNRNQACGVCCRNVRYVACLWPINHLTTVMYSQWWYRCRNCRWSPRGMWAMCWGWCATEDYPTIEQSAVQLRHTCCCCWCSGSASSIRSANIHEYTLRIEYSHSDRCHIPPNIRIRSVRKGDCVFASPVAAPKRKHQHYCSSRSLQAMRRTTRTHPPT